MEEMINYDNLDKACDVISNIGLDDNVNLKVIKKDKSLIEKVTLGKVIITEDNKQLLND